MRHVIFWCVVQVGIILIDFDSSIVLQPVLYGDRLKRFINDGKS